MKKLTKTLSLVLVVAMVLSLCVIGAGATFTDNDKITKDYSEAVTIATDLGIVSGVGNNTFAPAGTFTRAQAAVILTKMTTGANAAAIAPTTVTFKDVPATFWGYKYIEYAAQAGLVAGIGNGKFSPNATLDGYQWALMLLKVLGFDSTGMTPANWQMLTAKAYYGNSKFSSVAITNAAVTREAATQMAYDALFRATGKTEGYPVVKTTYNDSVPAVATGTTTVGYYDTLNQASTQAAMLDAIDSDAHNVYTVGAIETIKTGTTLAGTVFGVAKNPNSAVRNDAFGRPVNVYTTTTKAQATAYGWNTTSFSTRAKTVSAVPSLTYTKAVTGIEIFKALGLSTGITANVYNDTATSNATASITNDAAGKAASVGGQGTLTEVYYDAANGTVKIVCVDTYLAVVGTVTKSTTDAYGNVSDPSTALTVYATDSTGVAKTFKTQEFAQNAYVLVTMADGVVQTVAAAKSANGTMTAYTSTSKTIGGTTYPVAAKYYVDDVATNFTGVYTCYTDTYGNLIGTVTYTPAASTNYMYVISVQDKAASADLLTSNTAAAVAQVRMIDGSIKTVNLKLTAVKDEAGTVTGYTYAGWNGSDVWSLTVACGTNTSSNAIGKWIAYTANEDGTYTLSAISASYATVGTLSNATKGASSTATLNAATYYMTSATKLVTYDTTTKTTTTYTGYTNFPADATVGGAYTDVLYTYAYGSKVIDTVYATVTSTAATSSYAFVKAMGSTSAKGTTYTVYIDGVKTDVVTTGTLDVGYVYTGMQLSSTNVVTAAGTKLATKVYDATTATYATGEKVTLAESTYFTTVDAAGTTTTAYTYATSNGAVTAKVYNVSGGEMTAATLATGNYVVVVDGGTSAAALVMIVG